MSKENIFPKKYAKELEQEFIDSVEQMNSDDVKNRILNCESHIFEIEGAKEGDNKLSDAKEAVKELSAPYREARNKEVAKLKYCLFVLEGRGVEL